MITNQNVSKIYLGPIDQTQTISFDIPYISSSYLQLTVVEEDGSQSKPLRETTDYVVTPVYVEGLIDGATIQLTGTVVLSDKQRLAVERITPLTQETDFPENGEFESNSIERALDKGTMIAQEIKAKDARNISANILEASEFNSEIPLSSDETRMLTINNTGIGISDISVDEITTNMNNAAASAQAAKQSETNAKASETAAAQSAASALASQNAAEQIKTETQAIADKALTDISSAKTDAVNTINIEEAEAVDNITNISTEATTEVNEAKDEVLKQFEGLKALPILPLGYIGPTVFPVDEDLGLQRYLNGQVIIADQYTSFAEKLDNTIALYPNLAKTESEWQAISALSVGGQCGYFVVDKTAGTIRLPKIIMPIQGLTDLSKLGDLVSAGLPNITGSFRPTGGNELSVQNLSGAFKARPNGTTVTSISGKTGTGNTGADFDASLSNPIYGNSETVQQEQIQYPYFIQVATGVEESIPIINQLELNNPYTLLECKYSETILNNVSWLRSEGQWNDRSVYQAVYTLLLNEYNTPTREGLSVKMSTESYNDYDFVVNTSDETFRLPIKSKLASSKFAKGNGMTLGMTNGANNYGVGYYSSGGYARVQLLKNIYGTSVGTKQSGDAATDSISYGLTTDSSKSGIELDDSNLYLYYYVGETVQNANLINAGRIEEKLASVIPDNKELITSYGFPSDRYDELELGPSGDTYTAPADGWFAIFVESSSTSDCYTSLYNTSLTTYKYAYGNKSVSESNSIGNGIPNKIKAKKGDIVLLTYKNITLKSFKFIYAEGAK